MKHVCMPVHTRLILFTPQAKDANQLTGDFQGKPGWDNNDATFMMTVSTWLGGEYQLANGWGAALAPDVFKAS